MTQLGDHLLERLPAKVDCLPKECQTRWKSIEARLQSGESLEVAVGSETVPTALGEVISPVVAALVLDSETRAIAKIMQSDELPP